MRATLCAAAAILALPPAAPGAERFEPPEGKTLLIVGQERGEIARYWSEVGPAGGYMLYGSLPALDGVREPARGNGCADSGWMDFGDWVRNYPDTVAQVGLYMAGVTDRRRPPRAPGGERDANRPGHERGPGVALGRLRDARGAVVRRVVPGRRRRRLGGRQLVPMGRPRGRGHRRGGPRRGGGLRSAAPEAPDDRRGRTQVVLRGRTAPDAWTEPAHARVLAWIAQSDVKAYCYINQDWNEMPQWQAGCGGGDWGNTRGRSRAA